MRSLDPQSLASQNPASQNGASDDLAKDVFASQLLASQSGSSHATDLLDPKSLASQSRASQSRDGDTGDGTANDSLVKGARIWIRCKTTDFAWGSTCCTGTPRILKVASFQRPPRFMHHSLLPEGSGVKPAIRRYNRPCPAGKMILAQTELMRPRRLAARGVTSSAS